MKVAFHRRANHEEVRGGDLVQLQATAEALQRKGHSIDFTSDPVADVSAYDIVHIFNSPRFEETLAFFENAKEQGRPVAFSTIYWPKDELAIGIASSRKVQLARRLLGTRISRKLWKLVKQSGNPIEKRLFELSDILLPNSLGEERALEANYSIKPKRYHVVRNAIDSAAFRSEPGSERKKAVLSVGRIENRKNTLALISACYELGLSLTLIGGYDPADTYAQECLRLAQEYKFTHIQNINHEELIPYYYTFDIHAMVSWYETPGLASMEAACGGCKVVSTDRGSTREYFDELAFFCDPFSKKSIKESLRRAADAAFSLDLRNKILREYTWDLAAEDTILAYKALV